ncbi:Nn.00g084080.m01.CDS01 [Neocucurbitaria sp. VM-36]
MADAARNSEGRPAKEARMAIAAASTLIYGQLLQSCFVPEGSWGLQYCLVIFSYGFQYLVTASIVKLVLVIHFFESLVVDYFIKPPFIKPPIINRFVEPPNDKRPVKFYLINYIGKLCFVDYTAFAADNINTVLIIAICNTVSSSIDITSNTATSSLVITPSSSVASSSISTPTSTDASSSIFAPSSTNAPTSTPISSSSIAVSSTITASSTDASSSTIVSSSIDASSSTAPPSSTVASSSSVISSSSTIVTTSSAAPAVPSVVQIVQNPSFELGTGTQATGWTLTNLDSTDVQSSGRFQGGANTGSFSFRSVSVIVDDPDFGPQGTRYIYDLSQTVTVVQGASYTVRFFARMNDPGCDIALLLNGRVLASLLSPTNTYMAFSATVTIATTARLQQPLTIRPTCSGYREDGQVADFYIDDVTMTLNV